MEFMSDGHIRHAWANACPIHYRNINEKTRTHPKYRFMITLALCNNMKDLSSFSLRSVTNARLEEKECRLCKRIEVNIFYMVRDSIFPPKKILF